MSATLRAVVREKLGTRPTKILRLQNRIPCSIQGENKSNLEVSIDADEFAAARRAHEHLFDLALEDRDDETAMVRELQYDALGEHIIHVEFRRVVRGQKTETEVELTFSGHPKGGVLNHLMTHVPVRCLPSEIPDKIEVMVDHLEIGHPLLVGDLPVPEGVEILAEPGVPVAVVVEVRAELEPSEEEEPEAEGAAPEAPEPPAED